MMPEINFGLLNTQAPAEIGMAYQNALARRQQQEAQQMQNALARMQLGQAQEAGAERAAFKNALAGVHGGNYEAAMPDLMRASPTAAMGLAKQLAERRKGDLEADKLKAETAAKLLEVQDRAAGAFAANPTRESGAYALQWMAQQGMPAEALATMKARFDATPDDQLPVLAQQFLAGTKDGMKQLTERQFATPKVVELGLGGQRAVQTIDPATGKVLTDQRYGVSMTPGEIATDARARASLAQSDRHFKETQATKTGAPGAPAKPMPAAALKMQQEELDAIGTAAGIGADLGSVAKQIDGGKLNLGMLANLESAARNYTGASTEQSRNYASFKSTLEKLRNESLRLNKGVQTEGDAQRAWNELIANINDPSLVLQRIGEIQRINERAVALRKMNVDAIRRNYGQPDMDTAGYENQPAAIGAGASAPAAPKRLRFDAQGNPLP